jgi:AraC-like DNA-binding protein
VSYYLGMPKTLKQTEFYQKYKSFTSQNFQRIIGLKPHQFSFLLELFEEYVDQKWDKRGRKGGFQLADQLILTLRYLRSYPSFLELAQEFSISESYAHKIFAKVSESLVKILKLPNINSLKDLGTVILDVSEQEVERPQKSQKKNILENKNATQKKP